MIILFIQTILFSTYVFGQTIYKGDTVQLSITNSYRGSIKWQESVNGTNWTDIPGGTINNMIVKPFVNTQYRAVITEDTCDPIYSSTKSISISADIGLVVNAPILSSINANTIKLDGQITRLGGEVQVTERGMCWSKFNNPTIYDNKTSDGIGTGAFKSSIVGLSESTYYYIRSYAIIDGGQVLYSTVQEIKTLPSITISTIEASNITSITALAGGIITLNGTETIIAKGVCWSTSQIPSISNSKTTDGIGDGIYSSLLTNLITEKIYYIRAYVTASNGLTYYGEQTTIETLPTYMFTVQTATTTAITATSVSSGGIITMTGTGAVTLRGVCWSTIQMPTITDNKTSNGSGIGSFSSAITGLAPSTTYYLRAYATSTTGKTTYGKQEVFSTISPFIVTTTMASAITAGTAISGGNVTLNASNIVLIKKGLCWSTIANPTTNDERTEDGAAAGTFNSSVLDLKSNAKYYIRAYATDSNGRTIYGNELSFTTLMPLVISVYTTNPTAVSVFSVTSGGVVTATGPGSVIARGVCYSSEPLPTIENNKILNGIGTGAFTISCTGLNPGEPIYLRAFATSNSGTTTYGQEVNFTTLKTIEVTTGAITAVTADTATGGGNILVRSGTITSRGLCWSTNHLPTVLDSKIASGTVAGSFTSALTSLTQETTYYVRAYATDATGINIYGEELTFTTLPNISITTAVPTAITDFGATVGGTLTLNTKNTVGMSTTAGICWGTTPYPIAIDYLPVSEIATYTAGTFSLLIQNTPTYYQILPGVTYYVRAYYTDQKGGKIYGNQQTFTTTFVKGFILKTLPASGITMTSAVAGGTLEMGTTENSTSRGICWATTANPTILNSKVATSSGPGSWSSTMTGLSPGTVYHVRAYSVNNSGTAVYGKEISFATLGQAVTESGISILTSPLSYLTSNTGSGGGTVVNSGSEIIEARGVTVFYNNGSIIKYTSGTTGSFNLNLDFPYVNTDYQVRAFVRTVSGKIIYGNPVAYKQTAYNAAFYATQFNLKVYPKATSAVVSLLKYSSNHLTSYGFVYGTTPSPNVITDNALSVDADISSNHLLKNLKPSTVYYIRSYMVYDGMLMYSTPITFMTQESDAFKVTTTIGGGGVGYQYMGGKVEVWEPISIVSKGVCYSQDPKPTIASIKVLGGSGPGDFGVKLESMMEGYYYYCRAFATSSDGFTTYGNEIKILALAYVPPPPAVVADPGTIIKDNGGTGGGTPVAGPKYFIFARAYGQAKNCNEGYGIFDDVNGIAKWTINGVFDSNSYVKQKTEMETYIKTQFPGNKSYLVENSYNFCQTAKHVVIIQYTKKIPGWDCYSTMITAGYGNSVNEALNHAVSRKNNEINGAKNATYTVLQTINL